MGIATGYSAAVAVFNWSPAHISVSDVEFSSKVDYKWGLAGQSTGI